MKIKVVKAKQILDSRGIPTVEAQVETEDGVFVAQTPSGTSTGKHEAVEVAAEKAIYNVREVIAPKLLGKWFVDQEAIDQILIELAGPNKAKLGANAVLPVSIACCRALAQSHGLPLYSYISKVFRIPNSETLKMPKPCVLLLEGGKHVHLSGSRWADRPILNQLDVQEFMVVPEGESFTESYNNALKVYDSLKQVLKDKFGQLGIGLGYEGGFAAPIKKTKKALRLIMEAIKAAGFQGKAQIGIDVAASEFWRQGAYNFEGKKKNHKELLRFYIKLVKKYPILFIEDPFAEDDTASWRLLNDQFSIFNFQTFIVGDDLTVTNPTRMAEARSKDLCNAAIIKPNQIGTVTETIKAVKLAEAFGWKTIVSHRSGDTEDGFIADLSVGIAADFIKAGGPSQPQRLAKYNRLLVIEKEI